MIDFNSYFFQIDRKYFFNIVEIWIVTSSGYFDIPSNRDSRGENVNNYVTSLFLTSDEPAIETKQDEQDPGLLEGIVGAGLGAAAGLVGGAVQTAANVVGGAAVGGAVGASIGGKT